jgi:hypothetical protein
MDCPGVLIQAVKGILRTETPYRLHLNAAEEERLGKLVIAAASHISDRLGGLGNMVSWLARTHK